MCEYGHWRKLSVALVAVAGSLLTGCRDAAQLSSGAAPAPMFMTVEELAADYEDKIGDAVILEGMLIATEEGKYFLGTTMENHTKHQMHQFQVALKFESDNVSYDRMKRCLSGPTLVTGLLQASHEMIVKYVKSTSDTRIHRPDNCYHYLD